MNNVSLSTSAGLAFLLIACGSNQSNPPSDSLRPVGEGGTSATHTGGSQAVASGGSDTRRTSGKSADGGASTAAKTTKSAGGGVSSTSASSGSTARGGGASSTTSSTPPIEEPKLVTSGPNAYWKVGTPTEVTAGTADVSVDASKSFQDWNGFGGTFNEAGWDALLLLSEVERERAIKLLFDAHEGARFAYGRIPIGASDYAMDRYTLSETADDFTLEHFSIERDKQLLIPYVKAALVVNPDLHLWASPWTPPAWMKTNNDTDKGSIKDDPDVLHAHALYLAKFVEEYQKQELTIEAIHPQNEPSYAPAYPSCLWTPELLTRFIRDYLGPTFEQRNVAAEIWCGTMSAPDDAQHVNAVMTNAGAAKYVRGIGAQWNLVDSVGQWASQYKLPVMQTEHRCGNYRWIPESYDPEKPQNDHAYAEESWGLIASWLAAGVNSYSAWNMVLDTLGKNLNSEQPWPQNALLTVDRATQTLHVTPAYYVFRHFSQYVDPGAKRIATNVDPAAALAFENPDGSIVAVLYNAGDSAKKTILGVGGTRLQFEVPSHGWATVNWK